MKQARKIFTNTAVIIAVSCNLFISKALAFTDIQNQLAKECINQLAERNIVRGYANQTFRPQLTINRAEFAVLLLNAFPYSQSKQSAIQFKDVPKTHWAYKAIGDAYEKGFFTGYPDGTFRPSQPIPKVQAIAILGNHLNFSISQNPETILKKHFDDQAQIPNYARNAVAVATNGRIVVNHPKVRQLQPNKSLTRGEIAAIICQSLNLARTVPIEYIAGGKEPFTIPPEMGGITDFSEGLAAAQVNGKLGYINKTGELVIPAKFDEIRDFSSGIAAVKVGDKWGYINKSGKFVVPAQFLQEPPNFQEELAKITLDNQIGFIDKTGKLLFKVTYPGGTTFEVSNFSEGLAAVKIDFEKTGFIDKTGKFVIEPQPYSVSAFNSGLAIINVNGKYGYIDKTGKIVIEPQFIQAQAFSEGLAAVVVREDNIPMWGYIDTTGKIVITPQYYYPQKFSEGLAQVNSWENSGYIDKTGKFVISRSQIPIAAGEYISELGSFSSGLALVRVNNKFGYIDKKGKWIIKPELTNALSFKDGMARVNVAGYWKKLVGYDSSAIPIIEYFFEDGKWGYIRSPLSNLD